MTEPGNLYWDTCNFIRYLSGSADQNYYDDIGLIIDEAKGKSPKWKIHFSTIAYTEIRPEFIKQGGYADVDEFFDDLGSAFTPIDTNPNILKAAGLLRGLKASDKSDPSKPSKRVFGTADAIHLETCLYLGPVDKVSNP